MNNIINPLLHQHENEGKISKKRLFSLIRAQKKPSHTARKNSDPKQTLFLGFRILNPSTQ